MNPKQLRQPPTLFIFLYLIMTSSMRLLPILLLILCLSAHGQNDTVQCRILYEKIEEEADEQVWVQYNEELKAVAEKNLHTCIANACTVFKKYLGAALNNEGIILQNRGMNKEALAMYAKALLLRQEGSDEVGVAETHNNMGSTHHAMGNIPLAVEYYRKSLAVQERLQDLNGMSTSLLNLSTVYGEQDDWDMARKYAEKSLALLEKADDAYGLSYAINNLAVLLKREGKLQESLENHKKSLSIRERIQDKQGIAYSLLYIGEIEEILDTSKVVKGGESRAEKLLKRSYNAFAEYGDKPGKALAASFLSQYYFKKEDYTRALAYAQESLLAGEQLGSPEILKRNAEIIYKIRKKQGKVAEALKMHELYVRMHDSIFNENFRKENMRQSFQYDYDRKVTSDSIKAQGERMVLQAQVEKEEANRKAITAVLIIITLFALFAYNRFRVTSRQKRQIEEQHFALGKEKEKSDNLLLNILPQATAEELKETGTTKARRYDSVTVLFSDFVNFTGIADSLPAESLVQEIHRCYSAFDEILAKHGIEKIKTIGDGYMCVCGLPERYEDHALRTVRAALEMQAFLAACRREQEQQQGIHFEARIGIHSGPVVAGVVGSRKFAYDIWGETVNTAARMEQIAQPGTITVSAVTAGYLSDVFTLTNKGSVSLKNKGVMDVWEVEGQSG